VVGGIDGDGVQTLVITCVGDFDHQGLRIRVVMDDADNILIQILGIEVDPEVIDGTADGVFRISSPLGVHLLADDSYSGVEVGTVEILTEGVHYLEVWTLLDELPFDGPVTYMVASSSRLQPFEDPDDGQHLVVGDIVAAVIDYFSDIDWYTIDLEEGDTIVIWTDAIATDTAVFVDYPGSTIDDIAHDDDSGTTLSSGRSTLNSSTRLRQPDST